MTSHIGQSFGRYHILEKLGEGGMAVVYKAYDTRLERNVAIKVITPSREHSEKFLKRFERESRALAKLSHPNIVGVIDYGEQNGLPYLVMEYIPAGTLKQKLGSSLAWQDSARILVPIARALAYAHSQGVVHRDVKPSNILMTESGEPMLTDFGIAKLLETEETLDLTGTGVGVGTPEYMAPEQAQGKQVDARADIYSLGVVFYEMITGRKPYQADTPMAVVWKLASEPLPRPTVFNSKIPESCERVILKALAKNVEDRFQKMSDLSHALETLAVSPGRSGSSPAPGMNSSSRFGFAMAGLLVVSALLVAGIVNRDRLFPVTAKTQDSLDIPNSPTATITNVSEIIVPPVELSAPLSEFSTETYFQDVFDDPALPGWKKGGMGQVQDGYVHFEGSGTWTGIERNQVLGANQIVNVTFRHSPNSEYEIYVQSGTWDTPSARRWGIYGNPDGFSPNVYKGSNAVESTDWFKGNLEFQSERWYTLSMRIGDQGEFAIRIWDLEDPAQYLETIQNLGSDWDNQYWVSHIAINQGKLDVDKYEEMIISNLYTGKLLPTATPRLTVQSSMEVDIPSHIDWQRSAIQIKEGQMVRIEATGLVELEHGGLVAKASSPTGIEYCNDQKWNCTLPEARWGALIGQIGDGEPFTIGSSSQFTASSTGELFLGVNDILGEFLDNQGSFKVKVSILTSE